MGAKAKRLNVPCGHCGKMIDDYASNRTKSKSGKFFCSRACRGIGVAGAVSKSLGGDGVPSGTKKARDAKNYRKRAGDRRERVKAYYRENRESILQKLREQNRALKQEVIDAYGGQCQCCGEATFEFLTIDHIDGDGHLHRKAVGKGRNIYRDLKARGFPKEGFRLLCFNCNIARGFYGYCPHHPEDREDQGKKIPKNPGRKRTVV